MVLLLTDLTMPKSLALGTLIVLVALLLDLSQSYSLPVMEALFSMTPVAFIEHFIFNTAVLPLFKVPISHFPVFLL